MDKNIRFMRNTNGSKRGPRRLKGPLVMSFLPAVFTGANGMAETRGDSI